MIGDTIGNFEIVARLGRGGPYSTPKSLTCYALDLRKNVSKAEFAAEN